MAFRAKNLAFCKSGSTAHSTVIRGGFKVASTFSDPISTFLNTYDRLSRPPESVASRFDVNGVEADVLTIAKAIAKIPAVEPPVSFVIDPTNLSKPSFLAAMAAGKRLIPLTQVTPTDGITDDLRAAGGE